MAEDWGSGWPSLPVGDWQPTRDTLQLWTQVVGKIRMAHTPVANHWWNVPLYVTARGFTTSLIPYGSGGVQIDFDFVAQQLDIAVTDGRSQSIPLRPQPVADFYAEVRQSLAELDVPTSIWTMPVEIDGAIPFDVDHTHATYDGEHARRFWSLLVQVQRVLEQFRARFVGKASPVHLFWGGLDLAYTRFSGRRAPPHPGGAPHCGPHVMLEAYSHEVSSCGYWPGGGGEGLFYAYAYPVPPGYAATTVSPSGAHWDDTLAEFVLPYERVRTSADPDVTLLTFLQTTYAAAADAASWDRAALERTD